MLQRIKSCLTSPLEFFKNLPSFSRYFDLKISKQPDDITIYDVIRKFEKMLTSTFLYNLGNTIVNCLKFHEDKLDTRIDTFNGKCYS